MGKDIEPIQASGEERRHFLKLRTPSVGALALTSMLLVGSLTGCSDAGKDAAVGKTVTQTVTETVPAARNADGGRPAAFTPSYSTFDASYFSVDYPDTWNVEAAEVSKGGYLDTTIRSVANPDLMIRVDVTPTDGAPVDISSAADSVKRSLETQPGYRELRFEPSSFQGYEGIDWEFLVEENSVLLHKRDVFFTDEYGEGVAVLTQAPEAAYPRWRSAYGHVRHSLLIAPSEVSSPPAAPAANFCSSHECIEGFYDGTGYIVQCNDGMWSHSGGHPGACSYHGGETENVYSGPDYGSSGDYGGSGSGTDLGPGNGTTVLCADGSISHSGGIQGACSHHGGEAP